MEIILVEAKFAYKNYMNRSICKTPFDIVSGMKPRGVFYLRDVVVGEEKRSVEGEVFVEYMNSFFKDVKLKLEQNNHKYKENADKRRRPHDFEVGHEVMVHLKKGKFFVATYSKMKMRNFGPYKILRKFDSGNAYECTIKSRLYTFISNGLWKFDKFECI